MSSLLSALGQDYHFGYGRVGVLQQELLTPADIDKLLLARDEHQLMKALSDIKLSRHVEYALDPHRFIEELERWLRDEVRGMTPAHARDIFDILWLRGDAPRLAYLLKKHHGLTSPISVEPSVGATAFDPGEVRHLVESGQPGQLPEDVVEFVDRVKHLPSSTLPQIIDTAVSQFVVDRQKSLAAKSGSTGIQRYVAHHIDLTNIRTSRRLREDDAPADHLLHGGEIPIDAFLLSPARLASAISASSLPNSLVDAIAITADSTESSVELERGLARAIAHDLAVMRDQTLSIEPIFAFAAVALSQFKVLRTIIIGKSTHLSADEIRKLLPPYLSTSPFAA